LASLQAQHASISSAEDERSVEKREQLATRIAELEPEVQAAASAIEARREAVDAVRALSRELAEAEQQCERAKAQKDFARVGALEHETLPDLRQRLEGAEARAQGSGVDTQPGVVDESHVAETLAEWTQIPVSKMLEAEAEKLLKMEERLSKRVIGQPDAVRSISMAVRRGRVGLRDP